MEGTTIKRLKLYNSKIELYIEKKEKDLIKKKAYKLKLTMSEYIRRLILVDNILTRIEFENCNKENLIDQLEKTNISLGRD